MAELIKRAKVPVMKVGTHTDSQGKTVEVTEADLNSMISNLQADLTNNYQPPVVLGHPKMDDPRFGGITELHREGNVLFANIGVVPELDAALTKGAYPDRSLRLQKLTDGTFRIKHLGLLGVVPPAVQGLPSYQFAEDEECVTVDFNDSGLNSSNGSNNDFNKEEEDMDKVKELEAQLATERAARLKLEKEGRQRDFAAFVEGLGKAGKLPPAMTPMVLDFMEILSGVETFDFAEAPEEGAAAVKRVAAAPVERFKTLLNGFPNIVEFNEFATKAKAAPVKEGEDNPVVAEAKRRAAEQKK